MAKRDYYEVLGIDKNADESTIKKAYRKLAMQYHPDKNPDNKQAEDKFKEASEAYEVLSNSDKKRKYDQFGHAGVDSSFGQGGFDFNRDFSHAGDFSDIFGGFGSIFEQFFGGNMGGAGGQKRRGKPKGEDIRVEVSLSLTEIAKGVDKKIKVKVKEKCDTCSGTGSADGHTHTCRQCNGRGYIQTARRSLFGTIASNETCPTCSGEGVVIENKCSTCGGSGRAVKTRTVNVSIPPGVSEGQYINLRGQGNVGFRGGAKGDLLVLISEKDDSIFEREGNDIICNYPISFSQAALGADILVPTLTGKIKMKIPAGTQSGKVFRLRGQGLPQLQSHHVGDLYVKISVITPSQLSADERDLLIKLSKFDAEHRLHPEKSFFDKLKDKFF